MRKISMKLKIKTKSTKKTKPKKESLSSLGSLEELRDKEYLEKLRKKHHEGDALDNYCDMLETQINSLVDKLLPLSEEVTKKKTILYHPESEDYFIGYEEDLDDHPELLHIGTPHDLIKLITKEQVDSGPVIKHINKLREHINAAEDQLLQAQTYARDKIDR